MKTRWKKGLKYLQAQISKQAWENLKGTESQIKSMSNLRNRSEILTALLEGNKTVVKEFLIIAKIVRREK